MTVDEPFNNIYVGETARKGRGVFAQKPLSKGELIARSYVVIIPPQEVEFICRLTDYLSLFTHYGRRS